MRPDAVESGMEPVHLLSGGVRWGGGGGAGERIVKDSLRMCKQMKPSLPQKGSYRPALHVHQRLPSLS